MRSSAFALALAGLSCLVAAATAQQTEGGRSRFPALQAEEVKQKSRLVEALLAKSPAMARVAESGDAETKSQAAAAHKLYQRAQDAIAHDDVAKADEQLNEALRLIGAAARAAPDPQHSLAQRRAEYTHLLEGIETFLAAYERVQARNEVKKALDASVTLDLDRVRTMVKAAAALEQASDYVAANKTLGEAHDITVSTLNKLVSKETFTYDLRFASAAEELSYEMKRHQSYEQLIPLAVTTLSPSAEANRSIDRYFRDSEQLKAQAQRQAESGEYRAALVSMREAIDYLQKALQAVGIVVPQTMEPVR